jgi:hypothetical protein
LMPLTTSTMVERPSTVGYRDRLGTFLTLFLISF